MITQGIVILALATGGGIPAVAASDRGECRVLLYPAQAGAQWISATRALDAQLRQSAPGDRDCVEVVVNAAPERATVAVLTRDGRRAERSLEGAEELAPTVEGLIVTVLPESQRAGQGQVTASPDATTTAPRKRLLLGAAGGARLSLPGKMIGAVLDVTAGVTWSAYELSLFGGWNPGLWMPANENTAHIPYALEMGAGAGRRQHFRLADVIGGLRAGGIRAAGVWGPEGATLMGDDSTPFPFRFFPFVGAYTALAFSPSSVVRVRPQLIFQWLPTAASYGNTLPPGASIPSWNLTISIGAEGGIL